MDHHEKRKQTLSTLAQQYGPFQEVIERFGSVLLAQLDLRERLPKLDLTQFTPNEQTFLNGQAVVLGLDPMVFLPLMQESVAVIWPVVGKEFPSLAAALNALLEKFRTDASWAMSAVQAVVRNEDETLHAAATAADTAPELLWTALLTAYAPCIGAQTELLGKLPLDLWRYPTCPRCGSAPDMSSLEVEVDPSEFLISKSGQSWHHCPVCSQRWRFARMQCPACDNQNHNTLTRLTSSELPYELIYACEECKHYLPSIDMVEGPREIDFDIKALTLVHLDAIAQTRGYFPLSPAPWTALGLGEGKES